MSAIPPSGPIPPLRKMSNCVTRYRCFPLALQLTSPSHRFISLMALSTSSGFIALAFVPVIPAAAMSCRSHGSSIAGSTFVRSASAATSV